MITANKNRAALEVIQGLIICGRKLAYEKQECSRIAALLDHAEYLPALMLEKEDRTLEFEYYLRGIANEFPDCNYLLSKFLEST